MPEDEVEKDDYDRIRSLESAINQLREKDRALKSLKEKLNECQTSFTNATKDSAVEFVRTVAAVRRQSSVVPTTTPGRVITDPVFHEMYVEPELAALLKHPLVDRLRSVKQLSFTYQEQPTALHSRLSHSLGVARNVEFALQRIFERGKTYVIESKEEEEGKGNGIVEKLDLSEDNKRKVILLGKTAGLLHDLGHAPFGHALDRFTLAELARSGKTTIRDKPDKYYSCHYVRSILQGTLRFCGIDTIALASAIRLEPELNQSMIDNPLGEYVPLITAIIDSNLDADRIDFLIRDSNSTGLPYGLINAWTLLSSMLPTKPKSGAFGIAYAAKAVGDIEHAVSGRVKMYENCYETPAKIAAETMLISAVRYFLDAHSSMNLEDMLLLNDEELLAVILTQSPAGSPARELVELLIRQEYFKGILDPIPLMEEHRGYESAECDRYLDCAEKRDFAIDQLDIPLQWQEKLARRLPKEQRWMVEVYATPYDRFEINEQQIRLVQENEKKGTFEYIALAKAKGAEDLIKLLAKRTERAPRIEVFACSGLQDHKLAEIRNTCDEIWRK